MSNALVKSEPKEISYVPFGAKDPITLSLEIVQKTICTPTKSGRICSARDAAKFVMLCQSQHLNPFAGDAFLVGYDNRDGGATFSLIVSHLAVLKRAESSPEYEGMESGVILLGENGKVTEREGDFVLEDENCVGGWARVYRKGRRPAYRRVSIAAMKPNYETPFWNKLKAPAQIVKVSEADALRSTFPTLLGGMPQLGELIDVTSTTTTSAGRVSLVEVSDSPQPQRPEPQPAYSEGAAMETDQGVKPAPNPSLSPSQIIANLTSAFTFDQFKAFVKSEYPAIQIDSCASYDDLRPQDAKNFIRAKDGMLAWLKQNAGAASE